MSAHQSKTFFKNLKDTCRKIEHDVNEVKKKLYEIPENGDLASKKISKIQDEIKTIKTEAENVLCTLKPKLAHYHDFIQHFTELTSETEVMISKQESFLQQYGYQPLELATESELQVENDIASPVKACEENESFCATPNFLDYGIVPRNTNSGPALELKERKSSFEDIPTKPNVSDSIKSQAKDSDSTPTLEINLVTADTTKETPPIPENPSPAIHVSASPSTPTLVL